LAQPIAVAAPLAHLRFNAPQAILNMPGFGEDLPYMQGMWRYVRGSAYVLQGDAANAKKELEALRTLRTTADFTAVEDAAIPARAILAVAEHVLTARVAGAEGNWADAVAALEEAVKGQEALPYTEPAYWYYPARQSLGVALINAGRAQEAMDVLQRSLLEAPNNGWALFALKEAANLAGDQVAAREYGKLFEKAWVGNAPPDMNRI
jgi:tetratricopeptide (TPR) repeat protein